MLSVFQFRMWRKNRRPILDDPNYQVMQGSSPCYGTDLNRNWGYTWGGGKHCVHYVEVEK